VFAQALPIPILAAVAAGLIDGSPIVMDMLIGINAAFVLMRVGLLAAVAGSYERPGLAFWLSPFADPLAVFRVLLSSVRRRRAWRGRQYAA
jgi:dolichol-phosphate mannosyltransferase